MGGGNPGIVPASYGKFDVTFDSRGGSEVPFQAVAPGGTATEPQAPTKDGMVFDGWYTDEDPTSPFKFSTTINGDLALHAVFKAAKAANTLSAKAKSKKAVAVKAGKSLKAKKLFKVSGAKGKVTYKKAKGSKKITVAANGTVKVKKGCKKGTYTLTVKVRAAGNANYNASAWKTVKVKILVK
jgi:uncharacterized repeat protein (TIGR02543 family)